jgi:putative DNA primase/helicase
MMRFIDPIEWDWPGWLPRGFVTVLASEPGMGKSLLCLRLAACYVMETLLPDGQPYQGSRGRVVWCEGEASMSLNLGRAKAWGLDVTDIVSPLPDPFTAFRIDNGKHFNLLLKLCHRTKPGLVVMDSLSSLVLGGPTTSGKANKVTDTIPKALYMLGELARLTRTPVLLTHHLRKRTSLDEGGQVNLERLRGTSKIGQAARVVWSMDAPNVNDPEHRRLMVVKNNLMPAAEPLGMRIVDKGLVFGEAPEVVGGGDERISLLDEAADFLRDFLGEKPIPFAEVLAAGLAAGHSKRTLKRAKVWLGVKSRRMERGKAWGWYVDNN